jgi:hypothetical protein
MANIKRANASGITKSGAAIADVPDAPTGVSATGGQVAATVTFTPATTGGTASTFTATSNPGSITGTASSSPITVSGLTNGTAYTFTVTATNSTGTSPASSASGSVTPTSLGDMDPIAMVEVGSSGSSSVTFSSIPSTYTHLQIRGITRSTNGSTNGISIYVRFNSDTASNYSWHLLDTYQGAGAGVEAVSGTSTSYALAGIMPNSALLSNMFNATVIDILDYANTNKYKTTRSLSGYDFNGATIGYSYLGLYSGNWRSTSAVTSITLLGASNDFAQYSQFALYGIKDA